MLTLSSCSSLYNSLSPLFLCQKKEKSESERLLTEQLQARELELLQLRTEMETSQGTGRAHRVDFYSYNSATLDCMNNRTVFYALIKHLQHWLPVCLETTFRCM